MKLGVQPVESGANVLDFAGAVIVFTVAESSAAEVEAQHGKAKAVQCLHGVKYDFVMQCSAKHRMRMADDRGMCRAFGACIQQRFQSSRRAFEEERPDS